MTRPALTTTPRPPTSSDITSTAPSTTRQDLNVLIHSDAQQPLTGFTDPEPTAHGILAAVLARPGDNVAAYEIRDHEHATATSIRTLLDEYETLAHHALKPRWADLLTRAGLTPAQLRAVADSPAYGALSTALRRAEAHGLPLAAAMPGLVDGAERGADDLAAVLHARVERLTDAAIAGGRTRAPRLVGGMVPPALNVPDQEVREALQMRERLVEDRADTLLERARTSGAPWVQSLGQAPVDDSERATWINTARTLASFRDRYGISDQHSMLGPSRTADRQQASAHALAVDVLGRFGIFTEPRRPTARTPSPAPTPQRQDPRGR